ncbi:hypothetical protein D3C71_1880380 [compost metagenome]
MRDGYIPVDKLMEYGADEQQAEQDKGEALGTLGVDQAVPLFESGAAYQRIGKNEPAGDKGQHCPPPWKADFRCYKHGEAG